MRVQLLLLGKYSQFWILRNVHLPLLEKLLREIPCEQQSIRWQPLSRLQ